MKKLIIVTSIILAVVIAVKKARKEKPGVQVNRIEGLDVGLGFDLDDIAQALEKRKHRDRIKGLRLRGVHF